MKSRRIKADAPHHAHVSVRIKSPPPLHIQLTNADYGLLEINRMCRLAGWRILSCQLVRTVEVDAIEYMDDGISDAGDPLPVEAPHGGC